MFKTLVLICAAGIQPADCTEANALDVVRVAPGQTATMCGFFGQANIAATKIAPDIGKSYEKVVCVHVREAAR